MSLKILAIGHPYVLAINRSVLRVLAQHGTAVTVAAPEFYHGDYGLIKLEPEPEGSKLQIVAIPTRWTRFVHIFHFDATALKRLLLGSDFDIVCLGEEPYIFAGWQVTRAVCKYSGARLCVYSAQNLSKGYPLPFSWFERQVVQLADGWQACGELVRSVLISRGYPPNRVEVLSLAVDTTLFCAPTPEARRHTLALLGLVQPVIGFVGRLTPQKGIPVLLKALEGLPTDIPWSVLFLGDGPERENILQWAKGHGWGARVCVYLAKHEEVPRFLGAMDVLAAPSQTTRRWKEQFGRMLIEAFSCGVPVIGSNSGEIPHVIGDAGVIVPEAEPALWTAALAALLTNPARREYLAQLGLARAQEFSAISLSKRYADFYRSLMAKSPISRANRNMAVEN